MMSNVVFEALDWVRSTNVYEVNLRQYTKEGTFEAFSREMPRLKDMGVEVLWFMPITPIATEQRKGSLGSYYACCDFTSTNPEYGSIDDFRKMVAEAHELGLKVIIDWVANHTGWGHSWTKTNPDFFKINEHGHFFDSNGWDDVIDLDFNNRDMRQALIEAMRFWVRETGIDGFRCDMAMLVPLDFWKEARSELDKERKLFWLAECEEANYHEAFDATYTWEWMHKTADFYKGNTDVNGLDQLLHKYEQHFVPAAVRMYFTTNHDENSWNGTEYEKYGEAALAFAVFGATWNGIPMIYSGQELPNKKRLKFFDKDTIEWNGSYQLHEFYKVLLNLRKTNPALRAGDKEAITRRIYTGSNEGLFSFIRKNGNREVLVILNLSASDASAISFNSEDVSGEFANAFSGDLHDFTTEPTINLKGWQYLVFVK
ncbi:alpha-amylase family glycosyl hydrolase [Flavihumibacter sediminis]|nr:alpha-amylase family glycosyl hydrolase [Flavihumibacter sediminis]